MEQLSSLKHVLANSRPPFADFSVFGPHGIRLYKKHTMSGLTLDMDGTFSQVEFYGPATYEMWEKSYDVLFTCLVMLDAVSRPRLAAYKSMIKRYALQYGPSVWHLLYQTDVRCREEMMEAMNFRLAANHAAANATPGQYGIHPSVISSYDPLRPWDSVWHAVVKEETWWRKEFETPAMLIITRINSLHNSLDGDIVLSGASGSGSAAPHRPGPPTRAPAAQAQKGKKQKQKQHGPQRGGSDGMHTNRTGKNFCSDFQNGRCSNSVTGCACPKNPSQTHQCSRCLSQTHGAYGPGQACSATQAVVRNTSKGKGKGKNKR